MATLKYRIGRLVLPLLPVNRRTFDTFRHHVNAAVLPLKNSLSPRYWASKKRLATETGLSVNLGSGGRGLADWFNTDISYHADTDMRIDITRKLPFRSGSVKRILAEHVVEHIDFREDLPRFLSEARRVLAPGGTLRVIVPDARRFVEAYVSDDISAWAALGFPRGAFPADISTPMHLLNHVFQQNGEHLFAYDFETIELALRQAGFATVIQQMFGHSLDPELAIDQENHKPYSLYVDAVK